MTGVNRADTVSIGDDNFFKLLWIREVMFNLNAISVEISRDFKIDDQLRKCLKKFAEEFSMTPYKNDYAPCNICSMSTPIIVK